MPSINDNKHAEADEASWEATRGGISGAAKWGAGMAVLGGLGYMFSPVYRGLTVQFKVCVCPFFPFPFPSPLACYCLSTLFPLPLGT